MRYLLKKFIGRSVHYMWYVCLPIGAEYMKQ
jgi:hypothetical protein